MTTLSTPYFITDLYAKTRIEPFQMDNNIEKHIEHNIKSQIVGKCYSHYGYVSKIHNVWIMSEGNIISEDFSSSVLFDVKFRCTLCRPINGSTLIGYIESVTEKVIRIVDGPIGSMTVIINCDDSINKNIFKFGDGKWIAILKDNAEENDKKRAKILHYGMPVKIKILQKRILNNADTILCMGYLDDLATDEELKEYSKLNGKIPDYVEHIEEHIEEN